MTVDSFWLIICSAGAIQSFFLCIYFLNSSNIDRFERVLLSLLFLGVTLRLIKSIGWFFFDIDHTGFLNVGFVAHGFVGPLFLLYLLQLSKNKLSRLKALLILSPAIALMLASPFIGLFNFWYQGGYHLLLYGTVFYLGFATHLVWILRGDSRFRWIRNVYLGIVIFCLSYFSNYILGLNSYISGPILYSLAIYFISYMVFSNQELFRQVKAKKYKNLNLNSEQIDRHKARIEEVMIKKRPYLKSDFNLKKLSEMTAIPKHLLSHLFNEVMNISFTELTNSYRIEEAKKLLKSKKHKNHKIAVIAYECGFNTLSSFNASFKRYTGETPSAFKNLTTDS